MSTNPLDTKPSIVLIHGLWMTPRSWEHWKERYQRFGHEVLTPAYPGFEALLRGRRPPAAPESAWALLEERLRDASTFCTAVTKSAPEDVARALGPVERALTAVADSIARHSADWGATSRFAPGGEAAARATEEEPMHFEADIKPLFREGDRNAMRFAFDLWSPDDVSAHADAILGRLEAGTMPCDEAWPAERVDVFRRWIDAGRPV